MRGLAAFGDVGQAPRVEHARILVVFELDTVGPRAIAQSAGVGQQDVPGPDEHAHAPEVGEGTEERTDEGVRTVDCAGVHAARLVEPGDGQVGVAPVQLRLCRVGHGEVEPWRDEYEFLGLGTSRILQRLRQHERERAADGIAHDDLLAGIAVGEEPVVDVFDHRDGLGRVVLGRERVDRHGHGAADPVDEPLQERPMVLLDLVDGRAAVEVQNVLGAPRSHG
ncbi:hypothetical protein FHS23_003600 [Prauserella isguenensis]|uniref:Uncharacterized protein n=1 Tax=Prauserella isguenensis TaxID=1470180 RepID=A0A839S490_9PSEU|nr:hypothetical protein [Prauserella isguenensis]